VSDYRYIKKPITIQFKTDVDSEWGSDMSSYITGITIDEKVEDEPYVFVENELRLNFWDYDENFIKSDWNKNISEIEVRGISNAETVFYGIVDVVQGVNKKSALGIKENEKSGELIFNGKLDALNYSITTRYFIFNEVIYVFRDSDIINLGSGSKRLDKILDYLFLPTNVDYTELPIFNDSGNCYYYIDFQYFNDNQRTTLEFAKEIAKHFDAILNYDFIEQKLVFSKREPDTDNAIPLDKNKISLTRESSPQEATGIELVHNVWEESTKARYIEEINAYDAPDLSIPPSLYKYDAQGNYQYTIVRDEVKGVYKKYYPDGTYDEFDEDEEDKINLPNNDKVTYLIGESNGDTIRIDLNLMEYLYCKKDPDTEDDLKPPDKIFDSFAPFTKLRWELGKYLADSALKYLKPRVEYHITQMEGIPNLTGVYSITEQDETYNGFITSVNFTRKSGDKKAVNSLDVVWKQITGFTIDDPIKEDNV